jgi:hypothetical protein
MRKLPLETTIVKQIKDYINKLPYAYCHKVHGGMYQTSGISDILACIDGNFVAIEVKRQSPAINYCTELQKNFLDLIRGAGGVAMAVSSVEEVKENLKKEGVI